MKKCNLTLNNWKVNALIFTPADRRKNFVALFTHGYTSHKGDQVNWALKMNDLGIETIIFDIPGHYLGSFNEVETFEEFKENATKLFYKAFEALNSKASNIIIGGHSLGAMLALLAGNQFPNLKKYFVAVGLGIKTNKKNSLASPFLDAFMKSRAELVSPCLAPANIYPWIAETKSKIVLPNEELLMITGNDDYVVAPGGSEALCDKLTHSGSEVTLIKPRKLPHNRPDIAATHIKHHFASILSKS